MQRTPRVIQCAYYAGSLLVMILIITGHLSSYLPDKLAVFVSRNSEGVALAILLPAWIDLVRPRVTGRVSQWPVTIATALALLVCGILLVVAETLAPAVRTLNETAFALAVLVPYVQISRPISRWYLAVPTLAVLIPVIGATSSEVVGLAETFSFLVLVPLTIDLVAPWILAPSLRTAGFRVAGWLALLVAARAVIAVLEPDMASGLAYHLLNYWTRISEGFLASGLVLIYYLALRLTRTDGLSRLVETDDLTTTR